MPPRWIPAFLILSAALSCSDSTTDSPAHDARAPEDDEILLQESLEERAKARLSQPFLTHARMEAYLLAFSKARELFPLSTGPLIQPSNARADEIAWDLGLDGFDEFRAIHARIELGERLYKQQEAQRAGNPASDTARTTIHQQDYAVYLNYRTRIETQKKHSSGN